MDSYIKRMTRKSPKAPHFIMEEDLFSESPCDHFCHQKGCQEKADHRAPKSRDSSEYYWFCLDHVREYNQKWDYYKGMTSDEIESHRKADITWQRPSWPLGEGSARTFIRANRRIHDPFSIFEDDLKASRFKTSPFPPESDKAKALLLLELEMPFNKQELKNRYKDLVKKYHPDHNPNDPRAEDRLKAINHAYSVLKKLVQEKEDISGL